MSKAAELAALIGSQTALSNRNLIINGAMQVAQRGTSTSITAAGIYFSPDRFEVGITATDQLAATLSQSTTAPDGFSNSLKFEVTTAETTLDADEIVSLRQKFEGQNLQRIAKGTSSAEQVTASFWVRSSNTGTYILELYDSDNTRQVSKSYTINSANTWEYKTITFPADTTGAFDNDNNLSLFFLFWLAAGSNYTSGTLNTSWASATTANRVVGQTNLIASTNDFYITGVQLEVGEQATPFEHRSFGDELIKCQRYFQRTGQFGYHLVARWSAGSGRPLGQYSMPVTMRAAPSVSISTTFTDGQAYAATPVFDVLTPESFNIGSATTNASANDVQYLHGGKLDISAEL
jgi:hypothetical protein